MSYFIFKDILEQSLDEKTAGSITFIMVDYNLPEQKRVLVNDFEYGEIDGEQLILGIRTLVKRRGNAELSRVQERVVFLHHIIRTDYEEGFRGVMFYYYLRQQYHGVYYEWRWNRSYYPKNCFRKNLFEQLNWFEEQYFSLNNNLYNHKIKDRGYWGYNCDCKKHLRTYISRTVHEKSKRHLTWMKDVFWQKRKLWVKKLNELLKPEWKWLVEVEEDDESSEVEVWDINQSSDSE